MGIAMGPPPFEEDHRVENARRGQNRDDFRLTGDMLIAIRSLKSLCRE